jgi:hypothetical protein
MRRCGICQGVTVGMDSREAEERDENKLQLITWELEEDTTSICGAGSGS